MNAPIVTSMDEWGALHMGRSWTGHELEDDCPCPKAACGLVDTSEPLPVCEQHNPENRYAQRTMRQTHFAMNCTGVSR